MEHVYQQVYINLPKEVREHIKKVFHIVPTGVAEIRDQEIISDGVTNKDLEVITVESMAEYVGSMESFSRLWELTLAKVKYELNPPIDLKDVIDTEKQIQITERTLNSPNLIITPSSTPSSTLSSKIEFKSNEDTTNK